MGAERSDYIEEVFRHFLFGAIRRVFSPGCKHEKMLCLVVGQGCGSPVATFAATPQKHRPRREPRPGKSTFFRLLAIEDE